MAGSIRAGDPVPPGTRAAGTWAESAAASPALSAAANADATPTWAHGRDPASLRFIPEALHRARGFAVGACRSGVRPASIERLRRTRDRDEAALRPKEVPGRRLSFVLIALDYRHRCAIEKKSFVAEAMTRGVTGRALVVRPSATGRGSRRASDGEAQLRCPTSSNSQP